jgi:hypothetical protein
MQNWRFAPPRLFLSSARAVEKIFSLEPPFTDPGRPRVNIFSGEPGALSMSPMAGLLFAGCALPVLTLAAKLARHYESLQRVCRGWRGRGGSRQSKGGQAQTQHSLTGARAQSANAGPWRACCHAPQRPPCHR